MIIQNVEWDLDAIKADYYARDVAYYAVSYIIENELALYNRHVQAILYFTQVTWLVERDKPCFKDEIHIGKLGPMVVEIQNELSWFYTEPIYLIPLGWQKDNPYNPSWKRKYLMPKDLKPEDQERIVPIIEKIANYSVNDLIDLFQNQPLWKQCRKLYEEGKRPPYYHLQELKEYYSQHPIEIDV